MWLLRRGDSRSWWRWDRRGLWLWLCQNRSREVNDLFPLLQNLATLQHWIDVLWPLRLSRHQIIQPLLNSRALLHDALLVLLPLLIILSSLLFLLLLFLVCVLLLRRRRGISLGDNDGPIDMSREELIDGEGGFEGVEERWLETVDEETQRQYRRAKGMPNR